MSCFRLDARRDFPRSLLQQGKACSRSNSACSAGVSLPRASGMILGMPRASPSFSGDDLQVRQEFWQSRFKRVSRFSIWNLTVRSAVKPIQIDDRNSPFDGARKLSASRCASDAKITESF